MGLVVGGAFIGLAVLRGIVYQSGVRAVCRAAFFECSDCYSVSGGCDSVYCFLQLVFDCEKGGGLLFLPCNGVVVSPCIDYASAYRDRAVFLRRRVIAQ